LKDLSSEQRRALDDMTTAMISKMLHGPISHLKNDVFDEDEDELRNLAALKKLFDLEGK